MTIENFIKSARNIHGDKYDYSKVIYTGCFNKIIIKCPIHGEFEQVAHNHLKAGCQKCGSNKAKYSRRLKQDFIINQFKNIHGDRYDYSEVNYINIDTKVKIICKEHGPFYQTPYYHKNRKQNCPICSSYESRKDLRLSPDEFIERSKKIHGDKLEYLSEYKGYNKYIKFRCKIHNYEFNQLPVNHLRYDGCRKCVLHSCDNIINNILINKGIKFKREKIFNDCRHIGPLRFDFWIPEINTAIEYDGVQHRRPIGGIDKLISQKIRDKIKNDYCMKNGIKLIRINDRERIEEILNEEIK